VGGKSPPLKTTAARGVPRRAESVRPHGKHVIMNSALGDGKLLNPYKENVGGKSNAKRRGKRSGMQLKEKRSFPSERLRTKGVGGRKVFDQGDATPEPDAGRKRAIKICGWKEPPGEKVAR